VALPTLKTTGGNLTTTSSFTIVSGVSSGRALVISKIVVTSPIATNITITANGWTIATLLPLTANQVYTETGLVITAGGVLSVQSSAATSGNPTSVAVFGEEVDN
jgi:hypothetical protein